ncbi:DUF6343 family protein [Streptomyces sp. NPDC018019]|uniref:DUF6343 family protein n=1 Tax=Streptomyces sp. NPDC018019 TaxID=3365030 RepID=UPI0037977ECA
MRTGNEPLQARSPLKMRCGLALWGMLWAAMGTVAFVVAGRPGWAAACAVVAVLAATDLAIVVRHIHQGPHYQPGKDIPPYEPGHGSARGSPPRRPADLGRDGGGPGGHGPNGEIRGSGPDTPGADGREEGRGEER